MNSDDFLGCSISILVVSTAVLFLVMALAIAGCIESEATKPRVIVAERAEK